MAAKKKTLYSYIVADFDVKIVGPEAEVLRYLGDRRTTNVGSIDHLVKVNEILERCLAGERIDNERLRKQLATQTADSAASLEETRSVLRYLVYWESDETKAELGK